MTTSATPLALSALTGTWELDPSHTRIGFVARHAMVTRVRGSFNEFGGTAVIDGSDLAASTVEVTINVASIDTRNAQRDNHLRSNDFLAMNQYPTIRFVSTEVGLTSEKALVIVGDLTIRGVTRSVTVPFDYEGAVTDPFGNLRAGFEGQVTINRADHGLTWNAALETGGVLVGDRVVLEFEVSAIKVT